MKISLSELRSGSLDISRLLLHSHEYELYLVSVEDAQGQLHLVCDTQGQPMHFRSQLTAKFPFKGLGIQQTWLRQHSPYNEMIGNPVQTVAPLEVRIANPDQDYS